MKYLMCVDIGSTNIKAIIYDQNGQMVRMGQSQTPYESDEENSQWVIYKAETVWKRTVTAIKEAIRDFDMKIEGIAVTGIGMDAVPIDGNGNVLYPFISWRCGRSETQYSEVMRDFGRERLYRITGKQPLAYDTLQRVLWLKENKPEIYNNTYKFLLIEDFINWKLSGKIKTDYTMANCTSMFDSKKRVWSEEIAEAMGIDMGKLPDVQESGTILGNVTERASHETGLTQKTMVVMGGHDYQCAALACNGLLPDKLIDSTGTFDCITSCSYEALRETELLKGGISCENHVLKGKYTVQCSMPSGGIVEWFRKQLGKGIEASAKERDFWECLMEQVEKCSTPVLMMPYLFGSESPKAEPNARGAFLGINQNTTEIDFARAMFEGIAFQLKWILESLEKSKKQTFSEVISVGGLTKNKVWMQIKADIVGKTFVVPQNIEDAAGLGAALLAGIGVGVYADADEALLHLATDFISYVPNPDNGEKYAEKYEVFRNMYQVMLEHYCNWVKKLE